MSVNVTLNGSVYIIPETNEVGWGGNTTSYLVAIPAGVLQKTGGSFSLSAETDFGASFGLKSLYYKSRSSNIAAAGILRLNNNSDAINWRNAANSADLSLIVNASNQLSYNGIPVLTGTSPSAYVSSITGTTNQINASASTGAVTLSLPQSINTSAAVQFDTLGLGSAIIASSLLSLTSSTLGFLPPRMTTVQRDAISSPATGLFIYNTSTAVYNYYNGSSWLAIAAGGTINTGTAGFFSYYPGTGTTLDDQAILSTDGTNLTIASGQLLLPDGTAALPSFTFGADTDSGLFSVAANILGLTTSGIERIRLSTTLFQSTLALTLTPTTNQLVLGTTNTTTINATAPTTSRVVTIPDPGASASFVMTEGIQTINGVKTFGDNTIHTGVILNSNGSVSAPSYSLSGDTNTGFYSFGTDQLGATANGVRSMVITEFGIGVGPSGLPTSAGFVFDARNDTAGQLTFVRILNNESTSATSNAALIITTNSSSGGDPFLNLLTQDVTGWGFGIDNSDSDSFKLYTGSATSSTSPSAGTVVLKATSSGQLQITDGSVSAPVISFTGDTNTGLYRIGSDSLGVTANGANVATMASTGVIIKGTTTNDSAASGFVGEYISSSIGATNLPATNTYGNNASVVLTAGDWDVTILVDFIRDATTASSMTRTLTGIGTVTGNDASGLVFGDTASFGTVPVYDITNGTAMVPVWRTSISSSTTYYLKVFATYTTGTPQYRGRISARRVR